MWDGPGFAPVDRFALQGFAAVLLVVVSNVDDEVAIGRFDGMEFVVVLMSVACAGWNGREP